jgi:hypothetical protein
LFLVALEAPFLFAMRVTMPDLAGDPARRSRLLAAATPMTAPAFLVLATRAFPNGGLDENAMVYGLGVGALGSVAVWCAWPALVRGEHAGLSKTSVAVMDAALTVTAYVVSATWMYAASGELESLVRAAAADALGDEYWDSTDEVRSTSSSSSFPLKSKLASVATFHVLVSWCKYGGALFSTVACARVGKPGAGAFRVPVRRLRGLELRADFWERQRQRRRNFVQQRSRGLDRVYDRGGDVHDLRGSVGARVARRPRRGVRLPRRVLRLFFVPRVRGDGRSVPRAVVR